MKQIKLKDCFCMIGGLLVVGISADSASAQVPSFRWSQAGAIPGMACTRIYEDADPHAWSDNYLCSNQDLGLRWSQASAIPGMTCTRIYEDADPNAWSDNYLCTPSNASFVLSWSQAGAIPGKACTRIHEDADPNAWSDNFLCVESLNALAPETSEIVKGANNKKSMGGGYAEAEATFYRNGLTVIETHSVSSSYTQGTKGSVFVVGSDRKGRALFVSPVFDIPTACSKPDTCSSNRRDTVQYQVNSELAKYAAKIDVYVQDRSGGRSAREAINTTIKETCHTYDDLPPAAKDAIAAETGFSGCGSR